MQCPYCNNEMEKGYIFGDGRTKVRWCKEYEKIGIIEKAFTEKGCVSSVRYSPTRSQFDIESYYCPKCKKMIFDTDILN